jgi:uncharacterized protein (TIGR03067 family)
MRVVMNRFAVRGAVLALALGGVISGASVRGTAQEGEVVLPRELEGSYSALSVSKGGKDAPDEFRQAFSLRIVKDDLTFTIKDGLKEKKYPAKITRIDPKARPASIDIAPSEGPEKGKTFLGIYAFERGELTLAFTEKGDRPKDFSGDDDATVLRLRKNPMKGKKN